MQNLKGRKSLTHLWDRFWYTTATVRKTYGQTRLGRLQQGFLGFQNLVTLR